MVRNVLAFAAAILCSGSVFAHDFTSADALYAHRGESQAAIDTARAAYESDLATLTGADYIYAIEQMTRLDYYVGSKLSDDGNEAARKVAYAKCMATVDKIQPGQNNVAPNPEYYYWKGSCLAQWAKANGILQSLVRSGELFDYLSKGEAIDPTYEGGGFWRVKGAVYAKLPAFNPFGPRRDMAQSKLLLEKAIESPAYTHTRNPDTENGHFHYNNHQYYAETLIALGDRVKAKQVIQDALDNIDAGYVSPLREPETAQTHESLQKLLNGL